MKLRYLLIATLLMSVMIRPEVGAAQEFTSQEMVMEDARIGLEAGLFDAGEAIWNLRKVATVMPPENFVGVTNSDLSFKDQYVFQ